MFGSVLASVAGSVISGAIRGDAAGQAAQAQQEGTNSAIAEQRRQFDLTRSDQAPWRNTGSDAINRIGVLLGLGGGSGTNSSSYRNAYDRIYGQKDAEHRARYGVGLDQADVSSPYGQDYMASIARAAQAEAANAPSESDPAFGSLNKKFTVGDFWNDPVTQLSHDFGLSEGTKGLNRMAGARGMLNSGSQLKALTRFGTDYTGGQAAASSGRFYGDQDRIFNRLAGVSGVGQTAANQTAAAGSNMANNVAGLYSAQGNARGAAAIAQGNAYGNALDNIGSMYSNQSVLNRILGGGGGYGGSNSGMYGGSGALTVGSGYGTGVWDV